MTSPDIWYVYEATADGELDVDLCGSLYNTKLAVFDGDCTTLNQLGCNDDECGMQSALYGIPVTSGTDYYIQVGGYGSNVGEGDITVAFTATAPPAAPANVAITIDDVDAQVTVTWDYVAGLQYKVVSDTDPYGTFATEEATGITAGTWTGTLPAVDTFYRVIAETIPADVIRNNGVRPNKARK